MEKYPSCLTKVRRLKVYSFLEATDPQMYQGGSPWMTTLINAHAMGVNAVSWSPSSAPGSLVTAAGANESLAVKRLVTGGCDNTLRIWREENGNWKEETVLEGHTDWVRDVSWAPNLGIPVSYIASCSQVNMIDSFIF
jgi:protein transport protein SEC13